MSLFLGSIYSTMELDTGKLSGQVMDARRSLTGLADDSEKAGKRGSEGFMSMVKASALGNLAAIGFSKGVTMVSDSVGGAIKRVDTLNNSARSFANMGFDGKEITSTMDAIKTSIMGLPTSLDGAVRMVTLLASSTGNLGKSQKIFAALNNGILGFGGNAEMVSTATTQLSQAFAGGRIQADTWNSMLDAGLGPTLNAIARQMGTTSAKLKEGLSDGSVSVEAFQDQLIKLNTQGGGGLKSLEQIAKDSTAGIGTGVTNMQTAVTRGMAQIVSAVGSQNISGAITGIGVAFETGLGLVSVATKAAMPYVISTFEAVGGAINGTVGFVTSWVKAYQEGNPAVQIATVLLAGLTAAIIATRVAMTAYNVVLGLMAVRVGFMPVALAANSTALGVYTTVTGIATGVTTAFGAAVAFVTSPVFLVIAAIAALIAIGFLLYKNWDTIKAFAGTVWGGITEAVTSAWSTVTGFFSRTWESIVGFFKQYGVIILAVVAPIIGIPLLIYQNWGTITAFFSQVWTNIKTAFMNGVNAVVGFFQQLPYNIGLAIGTIVRFFIDMATVHIPAFVNGVVTWVSQLPGKISEFFTNMATAALGIATGMIEGVVGFFSALPGRVLAFVTAMWTGYVSIVTSLWNWATSTASNIVSGVVGFFMQLPGRVYSAITGFVDKVREVINNVKETMTNGAKAAIDNTVNFFRELPGKIMGAISGLAGSIGDKFKSIASDAWNGFKKGLGIHSPSYIEKAFMAIDTQGTSTVKSLRSDMNDLNRLANTAQRINPMDYNSSTSGADFHNGGGAAGGANGITIQNLNLPNVKEPGDFARELKLATQGRGK